MDFSIKHDNGFLDNDTLFAINNFKNTGFNLGPIVNLRLGEYFDLRALIVLTFGQRDLTYTETSFGDTTRGNSIVRVMKIESTFLEFPVLLKYKAARYNNFRPYLIAGICPKYDLASQKEIKEEEMPKIRLSQMDFCYEIGVGLDFYLTYFKFTTELKFSKGFTDVMVRDDTPYTSTIEKLLSQMFVLSFNFE
jgi:hypothetical protein